MLRPSTVTTLGISAVAALENLLLLVPPHDHATLPALHFSFVAPKWEQLRLKNYLILALHV